MEENNMMGNGMGTMKEEENNEIERVVEKHTLRVMPKNDRNRERRNRDFQ